MNHEKILDIYTDYLLCSYGLSTATGLSKLLDNTISHDKISRFLLDYEGTAKKLWQKVKPYVRSIENNDVGYLIIDDTIEEKEYTDENEIVCWHHSHSKGRHVKGMEVLSMLVRYQDIALPIDYHIVTKPVVYIDKEGKSKRKSLLSKNEIARQFISTAKSNKIKFEYVLADIWFSSTDNMKHVNKEKKKFVFGCKSNRMVRFNKVWHKLSELPIGDEQVIHCYIQDLSIPVAITKKVFINDDLSTGTLYLVSNDLSLSGTEMYNIYQKRWIIEEYHKSIKQNASLAKSPTKVVKTQANHIFCSISSFVKLEVLRIKTSINHFAMKKLLFTNAVKVAFNELQKFKLMTNTTYV